MSHSGIDFDFGKYVAYRRGEQHRRERDGSAYAFSAEFRVRRALGSVRPVAMAIEATTRMWQNAAKNDLLGTSVKVSDEQFPAAYQALRRACVALRLEMPPTYAVPASSTLQAQALGTNDEPYLVINAALIERFDAEELVAAIGGELGHIQNNHVTLATALYYLQNNAVAFVRWIVQPAVIALQAWARRAEITCDRASLLAVQDVDIALATMLKRSLGVDEPINVSNYLEQLPQTRTGIGKLAELFRSHPYLPKRVEALRIFAGSSFYLRATGQNTDGAISADKLDREVADIIKVF